MKTREEREQRANEIAASLTELWDRDRRIIQQISAVPVEVSAVEMAAGKERDFERKKLIEELRKLACEPLED